MSEDIRIRVEGRAGRITLNRPGVLNALSWDMVRAIDAALADWAEDDRVALLILDAEGDRAFCAGGDLMEMHESGRRGDLDYGRRFWADEYRMNARLFRFPKPAVSFLQGYTMGGGVGVGCHASHRIVGDSSRIAMPECSIGLVPDVGGSLLLARAPGRLGEYLAVTGHRMGPGDALLAEFADYYLPEARWPALKAELAETGDWDAVDRAADTPPEAPLAARRAEIDRLFSGETLRDVLVDLKHAEGDFARAAEAAIARQSPLSAACAIEMVHRVRLRDDIGYALDQEYRFSARAMEHGDFLEGIRAAIIDRDHAPKWRHAAPGDPSVAEVARMLLPLGQAAVAF